MKSLALLTLVLFLSVSTNAQSLSVSFVLSNHAGYNISCHGASDGTINAIVTGGHSPYTYSWSNSSSSQNLNSLTAGLYILTLTDSLNASLVDTVELVEPSQFTTELWTWGDVSSYGGSDGIVDKGFWGGNPPYTFMWSTGQDYWMLVDVPAGLYWIVATDANGCQATDSIILNQPPGELQIIDLSPSTHNGYDISCHGGHDGSIDLTVTGGQEPYSYQWSNGNFTEDISNLVAGDYSVMVTDANFVKFVDYITLIEPDAVTINFSSPVFPNGFNTSCFGCNDGSLTTNVGGGISPYTYLWSTGETTSSVDSLTRGIDTLTITDDNGCSLTQSIEITSDIEGWKISGNSDIDPTKQFVGTKDSKDLIMKTDNVERLIIKGDGTIMEVKVPLKISPSLPDAYNAVYVDNSGVLRLAPGPGNNCFNAMPDIWYNNSCNSTSDVFLRSPFVRVGIGTNSPASKLHIVGGDVRIDNLQGSGNRRVMADPNGVLIASSSSALPWETQGNTGILSTDFLGTTDAKDLIIKTNGQENMRISSINSFNLGGHIGIHTQPAPSEFVTTRNNGMLLIDGEQASLLFGDETGDITTNPYGQFGIEYLENSNPKLGGLNFWKPWMSEPWGTLNHLLFISNIGNVGVGSTRPYSKLQVNDGISKVSFGEISINSSNGYMSNYIGFNAARDNENGNWIFDTDGGSNGGSAIIGDVGGGLRFVNFGNTGGTLVTKTDNEMFNNTMMTIKPDGKVGIGTSVTSNFNGDYKLYVVQGIRTEKIKVDIANDNDWADHILKKDYPLQSLPDLENFISKYGHLPEIPSSTEVIKDGLDLASMDSKLLAKIEELTLYIIELHKEVADLKKHKTK